MQELAVLASRVLGTQRQFTSVADNIANVNTQGYRKLDMEYKESISRPAAHATASYVEDRAIRLSAEQGAFENTGNPMDLAINGDGFFAISVDGTTQYTRKGQFVLNAEGTVTTPEGNPLLDNAGAQIQVPQDAKSLKIAEDGTISTDQGQLAQIGVYNFTPEDMNKLQRAGSTSFVPMFGAAAQVMETPLVRQGFLEGSNVSAVKEMVNMQNVTQAYENSIKLMRGLEDMEDRAIRTLGSQ
jgi:flagellar basal-body rod protein FlgF